MPTVRPVSSVSATDEPICSRSASSRVVERVTGMDHGSPEARRMSFTTDA